MGDAATAPVRHSSTRVGTITSLGTRAEAPSCMLVRFGCLGCARPRIAGIPGHQWPEPSEHSSRESHRWQMVPRGIWEPAVSLNLQELGNRCWEAGNRRVLTGLWLVAR